MNMANLSFYDKESQCEFSFQKALEQFGALWHYCTPGYLNLSVNITEDDFKFSVSNLAISAAETGVTVVTDAHMVNHLHGLLACSRSQCFEMEEAYLYRLGKRLRSQGREVDLSQFRCKDPIPITDLKMARNEISYIHRNGYVANPTYTPFSYPWSGGSVYFCNRQSLAGSIPFNDLPYKAKRMITFRSAFIAPEGYSFRDGMILPSSYLNYRLGESFFRDAHQYFSFLSKKAEAYSAIAKRLGDQVVLSEEEMFALVNQIANRDHNLRQASLMPPAAKIELAKQLHQDYNASNSQIQRMLKLDINILRELFPV